MIEILEHKGEWFKPLFFSGTWQIALLNYDERQALENLTKLDVHLHTDEVFILHRGIAVLITADIKQTPYRYHAVMMEEGKVYNVPMNVWHNIAMQPDSSVYIVENSGTHENDYEFHYLSAEQKQAMHEAVEQERSGL